MADPQPGYLGTQDDVILARVGAFVLDHFLSLVSAILIGLGFGLFWRSRTSIFLGVMLGFAGYFVVLEWLFGQTIGKRVAGIVVVSRDGSTISFRQSLVRNVLRVVDGILSYAVGLVVMLVSEDYQRIGDVAANTLVVRARR